MTARSLVTERSQQSALTPALTLITAASGIDRRDGAVLPAADLRRLAVCAYLTGYDDVAEDAWVRAHTAFQSHGDALAAARCAFWLGLVLVVVRGAEARGRGWLARAGRLVE